MLPAATDTAPPTATLAPAAFPFATVLRFLLDFARRIISPVRAIMFLLTSLWAAAFAFVTVFRTFTETTGTTAFPPAAPAIDATSTVPAASAVIATFPIDALSFPDTDALLPSSADVS